MAHKTFSSEVLLKAATKFDKLVKQAEGTFQYDPDKMRKELDAQIGKKVTDVASKYLNSGTVSALDTSINYQSPTAANFDTLITYTGNPNSKPAVRDQEQKQLETQIAAELNRLAPIAAKIISKYQKEPLNYRYLQF